MNTGATPRELMYLSGFFGRQFSLKRDCHTSESWYPVFPGCHLARKTCGWHDKLYERMKLIKERRWLRRRLGNGFAGYTLIEILIVLFIISIVTSIAMLSIGRNDNKQMESFANEMIQVLTLAEEQAMLEPNVLGISFDERSYRFVKLQEKEGKKNWLPMEDEALDKHLIPGNVHVSLSMGYHDEARPQIIISTNGDVTPFTLYVGKPNEKPRYVITGDADGNITSTSLS